jgi:hypothetical protein
MHDVIMVFHFYLADRLYWLLGISALREREKCNMEKLALALKKRANSRSISAREKKFFPSHSGILKAKHSMVAEVLYVLSERRFFYGKSYYRCNHVTGLVYE